MTKRGKKPFVSVVINSHNDARFIGDCIDSVKNQTRKPDEVVVLANGCTDKTAEIAKQHGAIVHTCALVPRGMARDRVWRLSKGDIVMHIDSDMVVNHNWVEEILATFDKGYGAVCDCLRVHEPNNWFTQSGDEFYKFRMRTYNPWVAYAFKREVISAVGGWKDVWIEDYELGTRLLNNGYKIGWAKNAIRYHRGEPRSFSNLFKRLLFFGEFEMRDVYLKYPEKMPALRMALYAAYIFSILLSIPLAILINPLYILWFFFSIPLMYLILWLKLAFFQQGIRYMSLFYISLITYSSLIRAFMWPAGLWLGFIKYGLLQNRQQVLHVNYK